jgi:hypothetical protein
MIEITDAKINLAQHSESVRRDLCKTPGKGTTGHA